MIFRWHRGGLGESMKTSVDFGSTRGELASLLEKTLALYGFKSFTPEMMKVSYYAYDPRVSQHLHVVTIAGYGVAGFVVGEGKEDVFPPLAEPQ